MEESELMVLRVRLNRDEYATLKQASELLGVSLEEFVRRQAVIAAEQELLDRRTIIIPAEHWEEFEAWLAGPPRDLPALRELMSRTPTWEK
jgi:uncharacterized protein (DUF1778 family)